MIFFGDGKKGGKCVNQNKFFVCFCFPILSDPIRFRTTTTYIAIDFFPRDFRLKTNKTLFVYLQNSTWIRFIFHLNFFFFYFRLAKNKSIKSFGFCKNMETVSSINIHRKSLNDYYFGFFFIFLFPLKKMGSVQLIFSFIFIKLLIDFMKRVEMSHFMLQQITSFLYHGS